MDLYITRMYRSKYLTVKDLGIGTTNAGKKVMSTPLHIWEIDTKSFVVVDKPEYDLVLGNLCLYWLGCKIGKRDARYWKITKRKVFIIQEITLIYCLLHYIHSMNCYSLISPQLTQIERS
jgi:hypothetical protein